MVTCLPLSCLVSPSICQVAPGVKGLSMKELKNQLKKESCYTTLLTTARIRGVEKVLVACPDDDSGGDGTNTITRV